MLKWSLGKTYGCGQGLLQIMVMSLWVPKKLSISSLDERLFLEDSGPRGELVAYIYTNSRNVITFGQSLRVKVSNVVELIGYIGATHCWGLTSSKYSKRRKSPYLKTLTLNNFLL
jgi:hypothetical protein